MLGKFMLINASHELCIFSPSGHIQTKWLKKLFLSISVCQRDGRDWDHFYMGQYRKVWVNYADLPKFCHNQTDRSFSYKIALASPVNLFSII